MCRRWRAGPEATPMLKVVHDEAEPNEASGSLLDEIVREAARQMHAVALAGGGVGLTSTPRTRLIPPDLTHADSGI